MNSFGNIFRITTFGESHCKGIGATIDGCPPGIDLDESIIQKQLDRRKPGQNRFTTPRKEDDAVTILSGIEYGKTLGTPIGMVVMNNDHKPGDYKEMSSIPRPSHADYTYQAKYGIRSASGGGRASARESIGRVAAGAVADHILFKEYGVEIVAWVNSLGEEKCAPVDMNTINRGQVDESPIRVPDSESSKKMEDLIDLARKDKDSIGGTVTCVVRNVPLGIGDPVFGKLEALLAHAMLSIPAVKGFEIGSGFEGTKMRGSAHNDSFVAKDDGTLGTTTNYSGGIQGGITNGENIYFTTAFKPTATIGTSQETTDFEGNSVELKARGRHDPCVLPRAIPIVESMTALVLIDAVLRQKCIAR